jgi:RNA polymerase sigma factor (sigma-70 family)
MTHEDQFETLYAEHAERLFGFLAYRTGDRELAEDLVAETFERALRARERYDGRRGASSWLYTIALNLLRDRGRRRAAEQRALERIGAPQGGQGAGGIDLLEDRDLVMRALAMLSAEERDAIALRYGADLTAPEIARLADEPLTTVEGRIYRALRKLRERFEED